VRPGLAQTARDKVLTRMATLGVWPAATVADAKLERVFAPPLKARWLAPLAAERLRQTHLSNALGKPRAGAASSPSTSGSPVVHSTLDAALQMRLEQVLLDRLNQLPPAVSVATLVVENDSLAVRGYAGSADFSDNQRAAHVDMVRGVRSPGSTLKPFLYAMALDEGLIHSESLLVDAPQNFGGYAPGNFQASFSGPVSVSEALQRSLNVPAVDLLERLGPARFAAHLRNAGLKLRLPAGATPNLSLILGGGSTTLEELVGCVHRTGPRRRGRPAPADARRTDRGHAADERRHGLHRARDSGKRRKARRAIQRQWRPSGLENRHQLWIQGRLGHRRDRPLHPGRVGGPPRRHTQPRLLWSKHSRAVGKRPAGCIGHRSQRHRASRRAHQRE
jgi:membrane carboxypeptidase/penicillin-binding protein PbpC